MNSRMIMTSQLPTRGGGIWATVLHQQPIEKPLTNTKYLLNVLIKTKQVLL